MEHDLLTAWRGFDTASPPFVLEGDEVLLEGDRSVVIRSQDQLLNHPEFDFRGNGKLHLGLLPVPFAGNLTRSDVFILLQNPGLRIGEYSDEWHDSDLVAAMKANLRQELSSFPFFGLNPEFNHHPGYDYWRGKLAGILNLAIRERSIGLIDALAFLSTRIAIIELLPYHSPVASRLSSSMLLGLRSVRLVRSFVNEKVLPRAARGEALIVVTRQAKLWGISGHDNVIVYGNQESRAAHLTPRSRGGAAIARQLGLTT